MKSKAYIPELWGFGLLIFLTLFQTPVAVAQISIVVAKSSGHGVTKESAKNMFAGGTAVWDNGNKVQVVDQSDAEVGKTFYETFVGKSAGQVRLQWTKLVLSGQAIAPKKCADDEAVKKAVAADPNAIGYIQSSALDGTVREVVRIP